MNQHHFINYLEIPARNIEATKSFFEKVFGWKFEDYGPDYSCFIGMGIHGGFYRAEGACTTATGGALIVLYSSNLEASLAAVESADGKILKPIFSFPGGRRFQFLEPSGNEFAVWSE